MPSSLWGSTHGRTTLGVACDHCPWTEKHGRTTSGVTCHHCLWTTQTVERHRTWHPIIAFGLAHTVGRRQAWHDIIDLRRQNRLNDIERGCHHHLWAAHMVEQDRAWHDIAAFGQHTRSNDVELDMPTPPSDSPHGRTTSSVAFHYRFWAAHTVERRLAWRDIVTFRQHKRSNDVGRGMTSPP